MPGDVPLGASIAGIAIKLDRSLDDTTKQQVLDAANTIASCSGPFEGAQTISGGDTERVKVLRW